MAKPIHHFDFLSHNRAAWDQQAREQQAWSRPVSHELIRAARHGDWELHITPRPLSKAWLGDIVGKKYPVLSLCRWSTSTCVGGCGRECHGL
ncbi:hypothetical protein [Acinetobacter proteolyticus]|uniref:hypothetical protein n=1 Tax=Acinetobacter proteolyticus TaxID=1776741 RepID=UPI0031DE32EF